MESKIKMVVFDMAGTTVNEDNIVYKALRNAINSVGGFDLSLEEVLEHGAGKEKLEAIKKANKSDIEMNVLLDNTINIRKSIKEVEETLLISFILVVVPLTVLL